MLRFEQAADSCVCCRSSLTRALFSSFGLRYIGFRPPLLTTACCLNSSNSTTSSPRRNLKRFSPTNLARSFRSFSFASPRAKISKTSSTPTAARAHLPPASLPCAIFSTAQSSSWNAKVFFASTKPLSAPVRYSSLGARHAYVVHLAPIRLTILDAGHAAHRYSHGQVDVKRNHRLYSSQGHLNIVKFTSEINVVQ